MKKLKVSTLIIEEKNQYRGFVSIDSEHPFYNFSENDIRERLPDIPILAMKKQHPEHMEGAKIIRERLWIEFKNPTNMAHQHFSYLATVTMVCAEMLAAAALANPVYNRFKQFFSFIDAEQPTSFPKKPRVVL